MISQLLFMSRNWLRLLIFVIDFDFSFKDTILNKINSPSGFFYMKIERNEENFFKFFNWVQIFVRANDKSQEGQLIEVLCYIYLFLPDSHTNGLLESFHNNFNTY